MKPRITFARRTANHTRVDWRDEQGNTIRIIFNPQHLEAARKAVEARKAGAR